MRTPVVAGNWKMNGTRASVSELLAGVKQGQPPSTVETVVCAPYPYLPQVEAALAGSGIRWGAQNVSEHAAGAYTGEVSVAMLQDFGCSHVILGHSERRSLFAEQDPGIAEKFVAVTAAVTRALLHRLLLHLRGRRCDVALGQPRRPVATDASSRRGCLTFERWVQ